MSTHDRNWWVMCICHLLVSPGHNYLGRHRQPAGAHSVESVEQLEWVAGRGILGDRCFDHKSDYNGLITFFAMELIEAMGGELRLAEVNNAFRDPRVETWLQGRGGLRARRVTDDSLRRDS